MYIYLFKVYAYAISIYYINTLHIFLTGTTLSSIHSTAARGILLKPKSDHSTRNHQWFPISLRTKPSALKMSLKALYNQGHHLSFFLPYAAQGTLTSCYSLSIFPRHISHSGPCSLYLESFCSKFPCPF